MPHSTTVDSASTRPDVDDIRARYAAASPGRLANLARDWAQVADHPAYPEAAGRLGLIRAEQARRGLAVAR